MAPLTLTNLQAEPYDLPIDVIYSLYVELRVPVEDVRAQGVPLVLVAYLRLYLPIAAHQPLGKRVINRIIIKTSYQLGSYEAP